MVLPAILPASLAHIKIAEVIEFRKRHAESRAEFRSLVEDFIQHLSAVADRNYAKELAADFSNSLTANAETLASTLGKAIPELGTAMISVGVPTTLTALGALGLASANPFGLVNIGAGCLIGVVAAVADVARSIRNKWRSTSAQYCLDLQRAFFSDGALRMKIPRYDRIMEEFIND